MENDPPSLLPGRLRMNAAFAVHLLTASGAALAFGALIAAVQGEFTAMFVLLGVALVVDGIDGTLARRLKAAERLPRWSGETLDFVVDYLNYVFVPAFALATGAFLPAALAVPAALVVLVSGAIYFADREMKTADGGFRGFPALWNIVAFYLFLLLPPPWVALAVVALCVALTFAPIEFIHPLRTRRRQGLNMVLLAVWAALALVALAYHLAPPPAYVVGLLLIGVYFIAAGLVQPARRG